MQAMQVHWERVGDGVAVVTLDGAPWNLLSISARQSLLAVGQELADAWPDVRSVVLTAAGDRAFCAGADMHEFAERIASGNAPSVARLGQSIAWRFLTLPQITVGALQGLALGGGAELSLYCDFRVAGAGLRIGFPEITRGWFPGTGGVQVLSRIVGPQQARLLLLSGENITAQAALGMGLVDRVAPDGELLALARAWAAEWATRPAQAVAALKRVIDGPSLDALRAAWQKETKEFLDIFTSADAAEGVTSFFEKRPPRFQHR